MILAVAAFATEFECLRWSYVLPNRDVRDVGAAEG